MISHACEDNTIFVTRRPFIRKPTTRFPASRMARAQWRIQDFSGGAPTPDWGTNPLLPPTNEVWGKVILSHLFVILFTGGVLSQHALQVVSQHALQQGGCAIQHALQWGACSPGVAWSGGCLVWGVPGLGGLLPGGCLVETPRQPLLWTVRILLECILVWHIFWTEKGSNAHHLHLLDPSIIGPGGTLYGKVRGSQLEEDPKCDLRLISHITGREVSRDIPHKQTEMTENITLPQLIIRCLNTDVFRHSQTLLAVIPKYCITIRE